MTTAQGSDEPNKVDWGKFFEELLGGQDGQAIQQKPDTSRQEQIARESGDLGDAVQACLSVALGVRATALEAGVPDGLADSMMSATYIQLLAGPGGGRG